MRRIGDAFAQAFTGIARNILPSFVCFATLFSCLILFGSFWMVSRNIGYNLQKINELNEIDVFLNANLSEAEALEIQEEINALDNVSRTELTTKEEGLEEVMEDYKEWETILKNLSAEENPLPYRLRVFYTDNAKVANLEYELRHIDDGRDVKRISSVNSRFDIAATVESLQNGVTTVSLVLAGVCLVVCWFVVWNTIKLSVSARHEEITIMRYIGASRIYIAAPFVLESLFIGALGAGAAFFVEKLVYSMLMNFVSGQMGFVQLYPFSALSTELIYSFFGMAAASCVLGSVMSLGKYVEK